MIIEPYFWNRNSNWKLEKGIKITKIVLYFFLGGQQITNTAINTVSN